MALILVPQKFGGTFAALLLAAASPALAIDVPSGQPVDLQEVLVDEVDTETWLRFRFIAPQIDPGADFDATVQDMAHLCDSLALPYAADHALTGDVIVISMADRATTFGETNPEATQFFEAYRITDNTCIWEGF